MKTLSIIIPAYNEERTIHLILDKVRDVEPITGISKNVVIVNDGSTDDTVAAVERYMAANPGMGIRFIQQPKNMGKGAAIHRWQGSSADAECSFKASSIGVHYLN